MPPTHPSQADVAAAYRTLIAHETEPKEQDFYRDRLQRLEQATEPECELDCRSRIAAAGVGVYCPQCSAECAETDLTTQLAKAIRAAWVDRLDWDELSQGALEFLTSTGRLIPAGGHVLTAEEWANRITLADKQVAVSEAWEQGFEYGSGHKYGAEDDGVRLTAEQVEDVKIVLGQLERGGPAFEAAHERLRTLFPATEPASYCSKGVCSADEGHDSTCAEASGWAHDAYEDDPAPAEPAEEETKADPWIVQLSEGMTMEQWIESLPDEAPGLLAAVREVRERLGISSPVVPAPAETEWQTWDAVPDDTPYHGTTENGLLTETVWVNKSGARHPHRPSGYVNEFGDYADYEMHNFAPFVAAEEG